MFTVLVGYVVLFACFVARIRVEVDVDWITILHPAPPPLPIFFPTHNFFFNTSDSCLKSARA